MQLDMLGGVATCHDALNDEAWEEWLLFRKKIKKTPVSDFAAKRQIKNLIAFDHETQRKIIDLSMDNDYQGLIFDRFENKKIATPFKQELEGDFMARHTDQTWADNL